MAVNYEAFYVLKRNEYGVLEAVAGATVKVRNVDTATDVATLTADSNGLIAAGSTTGSAGHRLRFRVENSAGLAGSVTQIGT